MGKKKEEYVEQKFRCKICNKTHTIKLNKKIIEGREKFPFPYVFLHDHIHGEEYKEHLTILYIDNNLQVRHSEVQELDYDSLFSKEQVVAMMKPLLEEIDILRNEVDKLTQKLNSQKKK
ncbi:MAG: hypothetical protein EU539_01715 [Promethearchaeota archaeon]|nr:MAG: hypothetical protein EU539_01715 [Candidatus Lokiarchaeota archaeon]